MSAQPSGVTRCVVECVEIQQHSTVSCETAGGGISRYARMSFFYNFKPRERLRIAGMKITPVLIVKEIEASLHFWVDRMGFQKTVEVPEEDHLGFVILVNGGTELMLQTISSVSKDEPQFASKAGANTAALFIEVDDFADAVKRLSDYPVAMDERTTFYGMREIGVFEPGGHIVIFAAKT